MDSDSEISTNLTATSEELSRSFKNIILNCSGDMETLQELERLLNDEIDRVSNPSSANISENEDEANLVTNSAGIGTPVIDASDLDIFLDCSNTKSPERPEKSEASFSEVLVSTPIISSNYSAAFGDVLAIPLDTTSELPLPLIPLPSAPPIESLVKHVPDIGISDKLYDAIMAELNSMELHTSGNRLKSQWLSSTSHAYNWNSSQGPISNIPKALTQYPGICELMEMVNNNPDTSGDMDSCLVTCFPSASVMLKLHRDDEKLMSQSSSICTVSFGAPRHLDIDGKKHPNGKADLKPDISLPATDRSMNIMRPFAQNKMRHSVGRGDATKGESEVRFSISFRKVVPVLEEPEKSVHPKDTQNKPKLSGSKKIPSITADSNVANPEKYEHVILGDSLVNGLNVPGTLHLFKGGIHPNQVIQLLPSSTDVIPPEAYDKIRSLTLVVGTNALNVTAHRRPVPLLQVIHDYERLVLDLRKLFPKARIGLLNVIPRSYSCRETFYRIQMFNTIFSEHFVNLIPDVYWIRLYWEFVNDFGFLRDSLYGKGGVHLNANGKRLMSRAVTSFQTSYY